LRYEIEAHCKDNRYDAHQINNNGERSHANLRLPACSFKNAGRYEVAQQGAMLCSLFATCTLHNINRRMALYWKKLRTLK